MSLIYFDLNFMYGVRWEPTSFSCPLDVCFSQQHVETFPLVRGLGALVKNHLNMNVKADF